MKIGADLARKARKETMAQAPAYDAAAARAKAHEIFEGEELKRALDDVALLEEELMELRRDEEDLGREEARTRKKTREMALLFGCAIVLGIGYGLYKLATA